jgi:hypothetical protein
MTSSSQVSRDKNADTTKSSQQWGEGDNKEELNKVLEKETLSFDPTRLINQWRA